MIRIGSIVLAKQNAKLPPVQGNCNNLMRKYKKKIALDFPFLLACSAKRKKENLLDNVNDDDIM